MRLKQKPMFYSICSCNDRDSLVGSSVAEMLLLHVVCIKSVDLFACFSCFSCCLLIFSKTFFSKKFFQEHYPSVKQFGSRSGPTECRS